MYQYSQALSSAYQVVAPLGTRERLFIVKNDATGKLYIEKVLGLEEKEQYLQLKSARIHGVPEIVECFEENGRLIVIEEYVQGISLEQYWLQKRGDISEREITEKMVELCNTIDAMHHLNPSLVHGDITPGNVLFTDQGVCLVGFDGIGHSIRGDIYGIGKALNYLLIGEEPEVSFASGELGAIVRKCIMEKGDRFDSVMQLRNNLVIYQYRKGYRKNNTEADYATQDVQAKQAQYGQGDYHQGGYRQSGYRQGGYGQQNHNSRRPVENLRRSTSRVGKVFLKGVIGFFGICCAIGVIGAVMDSSDSRYIPYDHDYYIDDAFMEADFSETSYLWEDAYGTTYAMVMITNEGEETARITADVIAYNQAGKKIDSGTVFIDSLGPGETSMGYTTFYDKSDIAYVECQPHIREESYYEPIISEINADVYENKDYVTVVLENQSELIGTSLDVYAVFMDEYDEIVAFDSAYVGDADGELKSGAVMSCQLNSGVRYDHAEVYLSGCGLDYSNDDDWIDIDLISTGEEYTFSDNRTMKQYVELTNDSEETCALSGNATAWDADGNAVGSASCSINVLGPGESTVAEFTFYNVSDADHIDYTLSARDSYYDAVIHDLSWDIKQDKNQIDITVKNRGDETAKFVRATVLFFNKHDDLIDSRTTYISGSGSEIRPGKTGKGSIYMSQKFDHVKVYLDGRADQ